MDWHGWEDLVVFLGGGRKCLQFLFLQFIPGVPATAHDTEDSSHRH